MSASPDSPGLSGPSNKAPDAPKALASYRELVQPLRLYLADLRQRLNVPGGNRRGKTRLMLLPPTVRARLEECERLDSWRALRKVYDRMPFGILSPGNPLGNWLRRSGVYLRCIKGEQPDPNATARRLWKDAEKHTGQRTTTYLALLDGVIFAKSRMDFGKFRIQRLGEHENSSKSSIFRQTGPSFRRRCRTGNPFCDLWYLVVEEKTELSLEIKDLHEWLFQAPAFHWSSAGSPSR